jgi:F420-dependent methylenetetrahydromethanopterin dehydrogenase
MNGSTVSIDIGFSWEKGLSRSVVKVLSDSEKIYRREKYLQPSIVGEPVQVFNESIKEDDIKYMEKDKEYFVGHMAARHSKIKYATKKADKADTWTTKVLLRLPWL